MIAGPFRSTLSYGAIRDRETLKRAVISKRIMFMFRMMFGAERLELRLTTTDSFY